MRVGQDPIFRDFRRILALLLLTITAVAYWQVRHHGFINFDDPAYVTGNRYVQSGFTRDSLIWAFKATTPDYWHPLTWLSYMMDARFFGFNPAGYHVMNLLFHMGSTLLLFLVLDRMTGKPLRSAFVAALFSIHPLHVESVAWVAERKDVLCTFFWMLTLWAYVRYTEHPALKRYFLVLLFFSLGLMAKPMLITLPFVLLLLDYWPLGRFSSERFSIQPIERTGRKTALIMEKLPLLGLSLISITITVFLREGVNIVIPVQSVPMDLRIGNALLSYAVYLGKMLWPHNMAVFYPFPKTIPMEVAGGAGLLLGGISLLVARGFRPYPYLLSGWLWYLGTLAPVIGLVQWGLWPAMADRFTYVPLIGLFIMVSWFVPDLLSSWPTGNMLKRLLPVPAILILLILMIATWLHLGRWQNTEILFQHALRVTRGNYAAHFILARTAGEQGEMGKALAHYGKAIAINPAYVAMMHNRAGYGLAEQGKLDEAIIQFGEALRIHPPYPNAYNNWGVVLARKGLLDEAVTQFSRALQILPDYPEARKNLEKVLQEKRLGRGSGAD